MRSLVTFALLFHSGCLGCNQQSAIAVADLSAVVIAPGDLTMPPPPPMPDLGSTDLAIWPWGIESRPANAACVAPPRPPSAVGAQFVAAFPGVTFSIPVAITQAPGDASRWFVVQKGGIVKTFADSPNVAASTDFINITARVNSGPNEAGLLGIAFHPQWQQNHFVYLSYTAYCPQGRAACAGSRLLSTISRFSSLDGGMTLDPASEKVLLRLDQPEANHNGGGILFGPDGLLYAGYGDGGSGGDPHGPIGNGQNLNTLLGKMLRIDVDHGDPYSIPKDNPFAGGGGAPEIYAWGLRNPWRFSFDRGSGDLWAGDVGQNAWEEIDKVRRGGNYGWRVMEGFHCYNPQSCNTNGYDLPVVEYPRNQGVSVTGGYVYRGADVPQLVGTYIYGDYSSGRSWALLYNAMGVPAPAVIAGGSGMTSYGESNAGELYLVAASGRLYKLAPAMAGVETIPKKLSLTGCVDANDPKSPAPGLIPYDVASPLWSDGASKRRWMALPDNTRIHVNADGDFDLPVGSVLVKEFQLGGKRVETRLLVRHADGEWAGYTYRWDDAETDATLLSGNETRVVGGQAWYYPSRAECLACHTAAAGRTLGLEVAQLNAPFNYSGDKVANQLATLDHLGMFDAPIGNPAQLAVLRPPRGRSCRPRAHARTSTATARSATAPTPPAAATPTSASAPRPP